MRWLLMPASGLVLALEESLDRRPVLSNFRASRLPCAHSVSAGGPMGHARGTRFAYRSIYPTSRSVQLLASRSRHLNSEPRKEQLEATVQCLRAERGRDWRREGGRERLADGSKKCRDGPGWARPNRKSQSTDSIHFIARLGVARHDELARCSLSGHARPALEARDPPDRQAGTMGQPACSSQLAASARQAVSEPRPWPSACHHTLLLCA
ncbi:hypothetical protein DFH27DRAFT_19863 [Peziza echinospora]|nr:hypothetical protein DFH27DRAFT_19863 [Peziza echinospora]